MTAARIFDKMLNLFLVVISFTTLVVAQNTTCYNRFEYEYNVLQKLILLEQDKETLKSAVTELVTKITNLERQPPVTRHGGSTYIRWGRRSCPNDTNAELVYEGYVAGGHYSHSGAGSNYLCLPRDPLFVDDITSGYRGLLYGTEYETGNTILGNIQEHDVPCAVCRSPRPNVIMIPGRNQCYNKWQLEYSGMLVSSRYNHAAQYDYACLDSEPETINAGHGDANGALFYLVEGRCGSLKCPPYIENREITCAVCTYTG